VLSSAKLYAKTGTLPARHSSAVWNDGGNDYGKEILNFLILIKRKTG
jgi:hypothetical protein